MTSKERLLRAISLQPVDHVPLYLRFWSMGTPVDYIPFAWQNQVARVGNVLALGLDDTLLLEPPFGYVENYRPELVPGVRSQVKVEAPGTEEAYPRIVKVFETGAGSLQTIVNRTDDWPYGADLHLFDDYNLPRLKEPLIKTEADFPALRLLLGEPAPEQLDRYREHARSLRREADRLQVVLDGGWSALGDAVMWLLGMQRVLYGQLDEPEFIEQVLEIVFDWELRRMNQVLAEGVEVWVHMAWYEGTDFWSPRSFRRLLKPRLARLVENAHLHGVKFRYIITKGWKPLRQDLVEIGVDCLSGVDPVQDHVDLAGVKREIGDRVCLMGGLNSVVMLSQWDEPEIRAAVDAAIRDLAPGGGFILYPVDAIFNDQPWEKVEVIIDQWKRRVEQVVA
jgi:uroporphyrinogen-III decarboxylase